jgi:hypothetical protein
MLRTTKFRRIFLIGLLTLLIASQASNISAGSSVWTSIGLTSNTVRSLAIDPTTPGTLYAGTYGGGVFKSTNAGGNWSAVNTGLTSNYVYALAIDPTTPGTLYAGGADGVSKSTNGGGVWIAVTSGLTIINVRSLAIDPTTPGTLFAGIYPGGVFKTTNGGGTWSAFNTGLTNTNVRSLAIDPTTPSTLYAGTGGGGVFKSTTGGGNWSVFNTGLTSTKVWSLAIDLQNPNTVYAGTSNGVFVNGLITYSISGNVGVDGAILNYTDTTPKTVTADGSGNYLFTVSNNWSGTVTPSLVGYSFTPGSRIYTNVTMDQTYQDYSAVLLTSTFNDVPFDYTETLGGVDYLLYPYIQALYAAGLTSGTSEDPPLYSPKMILNRAMAAVFMLKGTFGNTYTPPDPPWNTFVMDDWGNNSWAQGWAEGMWNAHLTAGCQTNPLKYCPDDTLPRVQAVIFGLHMKYDYFDGQGNLVSYIPPPATGSVFADLLDTGFYGTAWAEQAYLDGLLPSCGVQGGKPLFCPYDPVNRAWAAYMIVKAKNLLAYSQLHNGSFEIGGISPDGWAGNAWIPSEAAFTWDSTQSHSGARSIKIASSIANDARWTQRITVKPNTEYRLSGWIKTENVTHTLETYDAGANLSLFDPYSFIYSVGLFGTNNWKNVSMTFNTGSNTEISIACRLGMWIGSSSGVAWFDDLSLEEIGPNNMVVNGSFENGAGLPSSWNSSAWEPSEAAFTWVSTQSHSGTRSVKITSSIANDARWTQKISIQPYTNYRLSGWIKTSNVGHTLETYDAGANLSLFDPYSFIYTTGLFGTNDWTYVSTTFNSDANTDITIACRLGMWIGSASGSAWFDDISLVELD